MKRQILAGAALFILVPLILYRFSLGAPGGDEQVSFAVPTGASFSEIADDLKEDGLIRSSLAFKIYGRWTGRDHLVRAGAFTLSPSMNAGEIIDVITGGSEGEVSVTIPEGFTVADIDALMAEKGFLQPGQIIECAKTCAFDGIEFLPANVDSPGGRAEGYLYPDTYFIGGEGSDPEAFLTRLLTTFKQKIVDGLSAELTSSDHSLHEIMTMAALIEEEAANNSERPIISGILWKRLDEGIILGVDAAVRYVLGKPRDPLTQRDLEIDSPYNLRNSSGLPPGPIANPGLASVRAALEPEVSPYYFYLHGNDGQIHYAVTNDEHNRNRELYLQ